MVRISRKLIYGVVGVAALGFFAAPAHASFTLEYIELLEIEEVVTEREGRVAFVGRARNNHNLRPINATISIILKKEGQVVGVYPTLRDGGSGYGFLRGPDGYDINPGEVGTFEIVTVRKDQYDEFRHVLSGHVVSAYTNPDLIDSLLRNPLLKGSLEIPESSVNITPDGEGNILILSELINNTNATVTNVKVRFLLYDVDGRFLGDTIVIRVNGLIGGLMRWSLSPGETLVVESFNRTAPLAKVERWEVEIPSFEPVELADDPIPTVRTGVTWGEIKQGGANAGNGEKQNGSR